MGPKSNSSTQGELSPCLKPPPSRDPNRNPSSKAPLLQLQLYRMDKRAAGTADFCPRR